MGSACSTCVLCVFQASRDRPGSTCSRNLAIRGMSSDEIRPATATGKAADLVTEVLRRIEGSDRGASASPEQQKEIDALIEQVKSCTVAVYSTFPVHFKCS